VQKKKSPARKSAQAAGCTCIHTRRL
jgi:hypothetical protein